MNISIASAPEELPIADLSVPDVPESYLPPPAITFIESPRAGVSELEDSAYYGDVSDTDSDLPDDNSDTASLPELIDISSSDTSSVHSYRDSHWLSNISSVFW